MAVAKSARGPERSYIIEPISRTSFTRSVVAGSDGGAVKTPSRITVPPGRTHCTASASVSATPPTVSMTVSTS